MGHSKQHVEEAINKRMRLKEPPQLSQSAGVTKALIASNPPQGGNSLIMCSALDELFKSVKLRGRKPEGPWALDKLVQHMAARKDLDIKAWKNAADQLGIDEVPSDKGELIETVLTTFASQ